MIHLQEVSIYKIQQDRTQTQNDNITKPKGDPKEYVHGNGNQTNTSLRTHTNTGNDKTLHCSAVCAGVM